MFDFEILFNLIEPLYFFSQNSHWNRFLYRFVIFNALSPCFHLIDSQGDSLILGSSSIDSDQHFTAPRCLVKSIPLSESSADFRSIRLSHHPQSKLGYALWTLGFEVRLQAHYSPLLNLQVVITPSQAHPADKRIVSLESQAANLPLLCQ